MGLIYCCCELATSGIGNEPPVREATNKDKYQRLLEEERYKKMSDTDLRADIHQRCRDIQQMIYNGATIYKGKQGWEIRDIFVKQGKNERDKKFRAEISKLYFQ